MRRWVGAFALSAALSFAGVSSAQDAAPTPEDVKAAGDEFDQARRAFTAKDYAEAAEHFENADRHVPSAQVLKLAIQARDKADQLDRAATLASMVAVRGYKEAELVKLAAAIIKRAGADYGKVTVRCDVACDVVVGLKLVPGRPAKEKSIFLAPGNYTIRAGWSGGRDAAGQVTIAKGAAAELSFEQPPEVKPEAPTPATPAPQATPGEPPGGGARRPAPPADQGVTVEPSGWSPAVFWVGVGLTAVAGGVTAWSGIDTQKHPGADNVRAACSSGSPDCQSLYQDGRDRQSRTNILAGTTAGLGVVTILIGAFATDWSGGGASAKAKSSAAIEPWLGVGGGATVGATGRF